MIKIKEKVISALSNENGSPSCEPIVAIVIAITALFALFIFLKDIIKTF